MNNLLKIGNLKISPNHKPVIIAEIGINHNGSIEKAVKIADAAIKSGAKIIKHQTHVPEDEMSLEAKKIIPKNSRKNIYDLISKCSLSTEDKFVKGEATIIEISGVHKRYHCPMARTVLLGKKNQKKN